MKKFMILIIVTAAYLSAMGQDELQGINGTYSDMIRKYSYTMKIYEKGENYTSFIYNESCCICVYKNMQNEGVEKILCWEFLKTKAEGYKEIKSYNKKMVELGMKPFKYKEVNGDIVYACRNKYCGGDYCHSEIIATPKRIYGKKGYNYLVYSVSVPTM